jgi:hypothetical protein
MSGAGCLHVLAAMVLVLPYCAALAAAPPELWRTDRGPTPATLIAADDREVTFEVKDAQVERVPWNQLVRWGVPLEPVDLADPGQPATVAASRDPEWLLRPAGVLYASLESFENDRFGLGSAAFFSVGLPRADVQGVAWAVDLGPTAREELRGWIRQERTQDAVRLTNGDELLGKLTQFGERTLTFMSDDRTFEIPLASVAAIAFAPAPSVSPAGNTWVGLVDGSRLLVKQFTATGDQAALTMPDGVAWQTPRDQIVFLQPMQGHVVYLADLEPESYRQIPFLGAAWPQFGRNQNVAGAPLRSASGLSLSGLGMHSAAQVTYRLDRPYLRFASEVAIDRAAGMRGSAVFRVFVDLGDGRWLERAASDIVRGGQKPVPLEVDLKGAKRLRLVVDYADRGDELDYADWLEARLIP